MTKVSIITVTYNSEKTILDTLISVSNQTHQNIEHLIIDGCSNDRTLEIVENFSSANLKIISEPDDGIYDAMNKGLDNASGDIVGFLNSDDMLNSEISIEHVVNAIKSGAQACYSDLVYVDQNDDNIIRYWKSGHFKTGKFAKGWAPPHPTFYIKTNVLSSYRFELSYSISADVVLMSCLMELKKINTVYIPKVLVRMRIGGASNANLKSVILQNMEVLESFKNNNIKYNLITFVLNKLSNRLWQFILAYGKNKKFK